MPAVNTIIFLFYWYKVFLTGPALRAYPIIGKIFKTGSWSYVLVWITFGWVIYVPAYGAFVRFGNHKIRHYNIPPR